MHFVSFAFLILFGAVLAARLTIGRRGQEGPYLVLLLAASLVFYAWHIPAYTTLLLLSTVVDFSAGRALGRQDSPPARRRLWLLASLGANLGLLFFFKYADFFLVQTQLLLEALGFQVSMKTLGFILPMGISFYTFQSMSYTIDVYRGLLRPMQSFWKFLLYVSFFPQLVAGPIVRATDFLYQIDRPRRLRLKSFAEGTYLILRGYFLKMVVADNLAILVDEHWDSASAEGGSALLAATLALTFGFQIFADFAGYSSIARGLAYLLGFRLPLNFDSPFIAPTFSNYWKRWHISLSAWLRDYLYIPLGGNRKGPRRVYVNLLLVMLLGGLWHGAKTTVVLWGAAHGTMLAVERWLGFDRIGGRFTALKRVAWFCAVQYGVLITWLFFRAEDPGQAWRGVANLTGFGPGGLGGLGEFPVGTALLFSAPAILIHLRSFLVERSWMPKQGPYERALAMGVMLYLIMTAYGASDAFIYFQF